MCALIRAIYVVGESQDLIRYINNSKQEDIRRYSELYSVDDNEALVAEDSEAKKVKFKRVKVKE